MCVCMLLTGKTSRLNSWDTCVAGKVRTDERWTISVIRVWGAPTPLDEGTGSSLNRLHFILAKERAPRRIR